MHVLGAAQQYNELGWPVVPVAKGSKKPACRWKELQSRLNTPDELNQAFSKNGVNISIVTGEFSGLVVLDADSEHGKAELEKHLPDNFETPIAKTARGWQGGRWVGSRTAFRGQAMGDQPWGRRTGPPAAHPVHSSAFS